MTLSIARLAVLAVLLWFPNALVAQTLSDVPVTLFFSDSNQESQNKQQLLISTKTPLNVYEVTVHYDALATRVSDVVLEESLCEESFVIEKTIDNLSGTVYVACGTLAPLLTPDSAVPLITLDYTSTATDTAFSLGIRTTFHQHDGEGTVASHVLSTNSAAFAQ